jgi:hypothetical protein
MKKRFGSALSDLASVLATSSQEVADGLANMQRQTRLFESNETEQLHGELADNLDAITFQQNVLDTPIVPTRAALYVYLNAMVCQLNDHTTNFTDNISLLAAPYVMIPHCSRFLIPDIAYADDHSSRLEN